MSSPPGSRFRLERGSGAAGRILETGEPLVVNDYHDWAGRQTAFDGVPFTSVVGVPLRADGRITGIVGLARVAEDEPFTDANVALLTRFGRLASLALENARLYRTPSRT